ncbi:MAG: MGMT family protein [Ignavibacteriales bacterium]|nr:MGMT family protein [Ignavibacteriales bacterium]
MGKIPETPFTRQVKAVLRRIPRGRVATYGQIAALAGRERAARGVAWILHSSSEAGGLPWHRVIGGEGGSPFAGAGASKSRRDASRPRASRSAGTGGSI